MGYERFRLQTFATNMTTGTAVPLTAGNIQTSHVVIQADTANVNSVYIGASAVTDSTGLELTPGSNMHLDANVIRGCELDILLQDIYALGTTGDFVRVGYYEPYKP